jgi:hypothetical protein
MACGQPGNQKNQSIIVAAPSKALQSDLPIAGCRRFIVAVLLCGICLCVNRQK